MNGLSENKKRVLLDTNVYDALIEERTGALVEKIIKKKQVVIYGTKLIRGELRNTPKGIKVGNKSLRLLLLNMYDLMVGKHSIEETDLTHFLALKYLKEYKGGSSRAKMLNGCVIVASATLKDLDIVCSNDKKTMLSKQARKAYEKVNSANNLKTPRFIVYKKFSEMIK